MKIRERAAANFVAVATLAVVAAACVSTGDVALDDDAGNGAGNEVRTSETVDPEPVPTTVPAPTTTTTEPTTTTTVDPIDDLVSGLTIEQRVGQLLMPVMAGTSATVVSDAEAAANQRIAGVDTIAAAIERYALGGVLYLGDNVRDAAQLTALSGEIEAAAQRTIPGIGALVSVDQEGGRVNRIYDGVEVFPSARVMSGDVEAVEAAAAATGTGLLAQGINIVLAPVADLTSGNVGVIGDRSYGDDPQVTADMVVASVRGLQGAGVGAGVKHWPGHGATPLDSHAVLPSIDVDIATWRARERVPFAAAIENDVALVMVGHLALPGLDPSGQPATVSPVLIEQLLRVELGFVGVVITDALDMGAVRDQDRAELVVQSIEAGVDILLAAPDVAVAHAALVEAVLSGRISEERLNESVSRVLRLKDRLGLLA